MWVLIAFVAAIGLTAVAIMAVFGEFGSASSAQNAQTLFSQTSSVVSNIVTDYSANPNFSSLTSVAGIGGIPSSWQCSGLTCQLPGGGSAAFSTTQESIDGTSAASGDENAFVITFSNLTRSECSVLGNFYTPNTYSLSVNGGTTANNPAYQSGATSSTNANWPPALAAQCKTGSSNAVVITTVGE